MRTTTIPVDQLEIYVRLLKHEDRLKNNLVWLNKLKEMEIEAMKRIKADAQVLEAFIHGGPVSRILDPQVRQKVKSIMLSHIKIDGLRSKLDKELADKITKEYEVAV